VDLPRAQSNRRTEMDMNIELLTTGLGWPEGPSVAPDGSIVFVESFLSQLTRWDPKNGTSVRSYVAGAPNSCVHGANGELYVCQNGGTVGPWRAAEMTTAGIQRVDPSGHVSHILTEVDGMTFNGPNDLVFGPDGHLYFTDPGTYAPDNPDPSRIFAIDPFGVGRLVHEFKVPVFPNGLVVEPDGSIVWDESYTGHLGRLKPNGKLEDLGKLPGDTPIPDGMTIGAEGRFYVTDLSAAGIHVLDRNGKPESFIPCGKAPTNCKFHGDTLFVTDAGVLATTSEPSLGGSLWSISINGGGSQAVLGTIGEIK